MTKNGPQQANFLGRLSQAAAGKKPAPTATTGPSLDPAQILASVGEALYRWDIESDALIWSANVGDVLLIRNPEAISSGRGYAQLLDADTAQARFDAVDRIRQRDDGRGVDIESSTASAPIPARKPSFGSKTPAAGSPVRMANRRTPTAPYASSMSATNANAGSTISPVMTS